MNQRPDFHAAPFFPPDLLAEPAISYEERRVRLLEAGKGFLSHHQERIREQHRQGASGRQTVGRLTSLADTLIRNLFRSIRADIDREQGGGCCLIALGGYGRSELNPRSDLDLMFYYTGRDRACAERVSERMLYLLWDLGLDVGYSVRTAADCLEMAERDITARTALLDSRYLVGEESLFQDYETRVWNAVLSRNTQAFIKEKIEENRRRLQKYGSSVYLLEPNIKEGEGGLRDLHAAIWIAQVKFKARSLQDLVIKGILNDREKAEFGRAFDYLWRIRNELHYLSRRKNDQLHFEQQECIAAFLGYRDSRRALAVEQFMQDYYAQATHVEHLGANLIARAHLQEERGGVLGFLSRRALIDGFYILRGELRLSKPDLLAADPAKIMLAFQLSQQHGVDLSLSLKTLIRENLYRINDRVRRSRAMSEGFLEILRTPQRLGETLREMHHLQFLNRFIPEFRRIFCKVQHDAYHIYTVDIHSIFAVEEIARLWRGEYREKKPRLTQVAEDVEKRELLQLAVLLHDIGKGEGKDHSNKGADMVGTIARRLGLGKEDRQRLDFLVRNHLQMAHISQRRDLHDDKLIVQFARQMGMSENLKMLYLLTFADLKAVGPDGWSAWKGMLLQELYEKAYQVLERGNFRLERLSDKVRNRKRKVVRLLRGEFSERAVRDVLKDASTRYLLSHRSNVIADHVRVMLGRGNRTLAMQVVHEPEAEFSRVVISTLDIPGLFSKITGVMAANGINIMGAQVYTQSSGVALDLLQVKSQAEDIVADTDKWQRVKDQLTSVIEGRVQVDDLVSQRRRPTFLVERPSPRFPTRVLIDNEVSDEYTVIDIYTHDRVGLLYEITKVFKDLGLYIGVSKISTKVDQVADTFYVQDIFGQKISAPEKIEEVRERLLEALEESEGEES